MSVASHVGKDLRLIFRDRKGLGIALLLPVVILSAYSVLNLREIAASGRNPDAFILVLSVGFPVLLIAGGSMVAERRAGTFQRLSRTPANMFSVVLAKSLSALALLTLQVLVIVFVSLWALEGRTAIAPVLLGLVLLATGLASHALGTLLSATVSTETQASQLTAMLILLMLTLSGFLQPLDQLGTLGHVARFAPVALGYVGSTAVLAGEAATAEVALLAAVAAAFLVGAGLVSLVRT